METAKGIILALTESPYGLTVAASFVTCLVVFVLLMRKQR